MSTSKTQIGKTSAQGVGKPPIVILVNEQEVSMEDRIATGTQIKAAAIAQGVNIQSNFMLLEELPNGTSKKIGDSDEVKLHRHMKFVAIAPDDNS